MFWVTTTAMALTPVMIANVQKRNVCKSIVPLRACV
jgi:hypothetical protein